MSNSAAAVSHGLKVLLTLLRYKLLRVQDVDHKISICSAIQDCAHAWDAIRPRADSNISIKLPQRLLTLSTAVASSIDNKAALGSFIASLDGKTTMVAARVRGGIDILL